MNRRANPGTHVFNRKAARRPGGFTLIELVMFIVIVGIGLAGILKGINAVIVNSADPQVTRQALAIAQSLMEEVSLQAFTYCDPDDPNVENATSATLDLTQTNPVACWQSLQTAATAGEGRFVSPQFDNVIDYNGYTMNGIVDITNSAVSGLSGYTATVAVSAQQLDTITQASGDALRIRVTVTGPGGVTQILDGYRTRYAPNSAP